MSEVARYNFDGEKNAHWILETDEGHFVKHEDYEALAQKMAATEQDEQNTLKERDAAEDALATMYEAVMGEAPEWSNIFGYDDAIETVEMTLSALQQKLYAMGHECGKMLGLLNDICRYHEECTHDDTMHALIPLEYVSAINTFVERDVEGENPFAATDEFFNEVRAEGVEMFASYWESNCAHDDTFVGKKAKHFAAKLRAGSTEGGV